MRSYQVIRGCLATALTGVAALVLIQPSASAQSSSDCTGDVVISAPSVKLASPSPASSSAVIGSQLAPGTYVVTGASYDPAHPQQDDQPNEQWSARFGDADGGQVQTGVSPDLPLANQMISFGFGEVTFSASPTVVTFVHAGGQTGVADSVFPLCVGLTRKVDPTTSTSSTTTTTTVVIAPETTVPATTLAPTTAPGPVVLVLPTPTPAPSAPSPTTSAAPTTIATTVARLASAPPTAEAPIVSVPPVPEASVAGTTVTQPLAYTGYGTGWLASLGISLVAVGGVVAFRFRKQQA